MTTIQQGHFTPLPEAVCEAVLQLTTQGRPAGLDAVRKRLLEAFPHMQPPAERVLYDTLAQLTAERKVYQTSRGYFIVTPEYELLQYYIFSCWMPNNLYLYLI